MIVLKRKHRTILPDLLFRDYQYYCFVARTDDGTSVPFIAYCPDLDITSQGINEDDAFDMIQDAVSLMLDSMEPWKRPKASYLYPARKKVNKEFPEIDPMLWTHRPVYMLVPYRR